jgi:CBS domain-containing protein
MDKVPIEKVMTEGVIAIDADATVLEASQKLEREGIRGLIVTENNDAVGVIVCRDIVYKLVADGKNPENTTIADVMSGDLIVADDDELLEEVAMAMVRNSISRVPVVRDDMLVGILTQSDIVRAWPGFAELVEEEREMDAEAAPREVTRSGVCEECDNYSEELLSAGGRLLCSECRASRDMS